MRLLIVIGLLLTPFSTSAASGMPVVSFGLPCLLLAAAAGFLRPSTDAFLLTRSTAPAMLAAAASVFSIAMLAFFAPDPGRSLARVAPHVICYLLAFQLLARFRRHPDELARFALTVIAVSGAVLAVYYAIHLALAARAYGANTVIVERYTGGLAALPWGSTNVIAAALIFPHIACVLLKQGYRCRWTTPVLGLILLAVLLTTSRAGTLFHGAMLLAGCVLAGRFRALAAWAACILLLLAGYAHFARENLELLISTRLSGERDLSNGRFDSFLMKWEYISDNPMSPVGYYGSMATFDLSSHNVFLTVLVEQGVLGLACMLLFLGACLHALFYHRSEARRERRMRRLALAGSLVAFLNLMVEDANFTQPYMVYFWMFFIATMAFVMHLGAAAPGARPACRSGVKAWQT
ncbi:O-antigen ligase family protein [Noviherbaspirillum aridicola]|uniref:O-antigen ligase-related domain-containing protein n=1 Tax=Noviherbaspirillum aridicola TaxID=2849687 RepID=A0ABQ4Q376_9BURK|nr:O-antigen ligase family protein [Noviherbaspirillum aridicola]GIZ51615.1 hypothetical protein NCCP691_16290 [Noviherbaspirillum aridicola]